MAEAQSKRTDVEVANEASVFKQVVPGPAEDATSMESDKVIPGNETPAKAIHRRTLNDAGSTMPNLLKPFSCYEGESSELWRPYSPEPIVSTNATPDPNLPLPEESPGTEETPRDHTGKKD